MPDRRNKLVNSPEIKKRYWIRKKGPLGAMSQARSIRTQANKRNGWVFNRKKKGK